MLIRSPITIGSLSPRTTDPNQILDPEPTTTFPMIVAHGAIQHDRRRKIIRVLEERDNHADDNERDAHATDR